MNEKTPISIRATVFISALFLGLLSAAPQETTATNRSVALPSSVDLRPTFSELGLKQRQQGARGTCSVFTMVGALEFAIARSQGHGEAFSVDFLNWAANQHRATADGGFFSDMWKGFASHGICTEEQMPYAAKFDSSRAPDPAAVAAAKVPLEIGLTHHWIKEWNVKTGLTEAQLLGIKQTLNHGWPVCGGFRWPRNPRWEKGILQMCAPEDVFDGHSVLLVGYRDNPSDQGGGVLLFRNSNGGTEGRMPYAYAQAYMNDALWIESPVKTAISEAGHARSVSE